MIQNRGQHPFKQGAKLALLISLPAGAEPSLTGATWELGAAQDVGDQLVLW